MADRRAFVGGLLAAALAPRALAQPGSRVYVIGYLSGGQGPEWLAKVLGERGYVVGRNLRIETRIPPDWNPDTLAKAAAELVALRPDVLYAIMGNRVGALAAATRTIPIVTGGVPDPVGGGFAKSLRRPGGNITGLSLGLHESAEIVMGILKSMRPQLRRVGGIFPKGLSTVNAGSWWADAARKAGLEWMSAGVATEEEAERALASLAGQAVFLAPMKDTELGLKIAAIATRLRIVTVGPPDHQVVITYGLDFKDDQARVAAILDQVLRGANPAEIPFELPDRPVFILNRRTARAVGLEIPRDVLLRATEVID
jgi:putative ABC transport system substrate-binding protein